MPVERTLGFVSNSGVVGGLGSVSQVIITLTKHPHNANDVSRQAGDDDRAALTAEVSRMLWEWEGSDELASEFADRLVSYILGKTASTNATPPRASRMTVTAS